MRITGSFIYLLMISALVICTIQARRSSRPVRNSVSFLETALIVPLVGNLLILVASGRTLAMFGSYLSLLGMDLVMGALVNFSNSYCQGIAKGKKKGKHKPTVMYLLLAADAIQLMLNPLLHHVFDVKAVELEGFAFYTQVAYFGQTIHRIADYVVFFCAILIFILATVMTPRIYREKFTVILIALAGVGLLQANQFFTTTSFNISVIGYSLIGMLVFYFSIIYRPLRLLDRMLSNIVCDLSDAFFIFDPGGNCIWANDEGCRLAGIKDSSDEQLKQRLIELFGEPDSEDTGGHGLKRTIGTGEDMRYYVLTESQVKDDSGNLNGTYLHVRDVTESEHALQLRDKQLGKIKQDAYRDALTGVGSKTAYNMAVNELNGKILSGLTEIAIVMIDMNDLKHINDEYGHKAGDSYIKGCCHMICEAFKHSPVFRIGGDEFVAILQGQDFMERLRIIERLRAAFAESAFNEDIDPWERYSAAVGIAEHASDDNSFELVFKRADQAMKKKKKRYKDKHGSYR